MSNKISIMLDSGAHSLHNKFNRGKHISQKIDFSTTKEFKEYLERYIVFLHKYKDLVYPYVTLDVIFNPEATYKVQKYIESHGLAPMPVYHYGTDIKWLKKYVEEGYDYIGIGGLGQEVSKASFIEHGDKVFDYLCDDEGWPCVKTHGFAMTSVDLLLRYPFYSVDSTTWVAVGRFGGFYMPPYDVRKKKWLYDVSPWHVIISDKSPKRSIGGQHYSTFSAIARINIDKYLKEEGYTVEELSTDYKKRDELNIKYWQTFERNFVDKPFKVKRTKGFF